MEDRYEMILMRIYEKDEQMSDRTWRILGKCLLDVIWTQKLGLCGRGLDILEVDLVMASRRKSWKWIWLVFVDAIGMCTYLSTARVYGNENGVEAICSCLRLRQDSQQVCETDRLLWTTCLLCESRHRSGVNRIVQK